MDDKPAMKKAFTLVEVLIALAISALLLTAVAAAFNASLMNYQENQDQFQAVNSARQALSRMTTQLRTGHAVDPAAPSNQCSFFTADDQDLTFEFRSDDHRLYLITNSDDAEYVLCENVQAASFSKTPTDSGADCKSVVIQMTVQVGNSTQPLSAAAVIRRNL